jgi:1-acyl-sn-glycerol-3-phosphate acyltransferase
MTSRVNRPPFLALRGLLKLLLLPLLGWKLRFRVVGGERLPRARRSLILACNHAALIDTVLLILAVRPRFTVCGAKPPYFRTAGRRFLMAVANILRVEDQATFLDDCRRLLRDGEILLIYPEMGRNPDGLGDFSDWAAEVALASGAPLLPCYLFGTTRGQEGGVRLFVGREMRPEGGAVELTASLKRAIEQLAPEMRTSAR